MQAKGVAATVNIKSIQGGTVVNAVPGKAQAVICGIDRQVIRELLATKFSDQEITLTELTDCPNAETQITALGKAAHGSMPERGKNAAALLLSVLGELPLSQAEHEAVSRINALFGQDYNGIAAGIATDDEVSGALTLNMGTLNWQDSKYTVGLDMRYPISAPFAEIYENLANICAENGMKLEISEHKAPLYVPADQAPASLLLELYREYEPQAEPLAVGGGTYCRAFKNFVAFGPLRPQTNDLMHQADEYITKEDFEFLRRIYAQAIWRLASR
jgi:succinyl-diaminopimelate desuccinylase